MRLRFVSAYGNGPAVCRFHLRAAGRLGRLAARCERKATGALLEDDMPRHCGYLKLASLAYGSAARHYQAAQDSGAIPPILTGLTRAV